MITADEIRKHLAKPLPDEDDPYYTPADPHLMLAYQELDEARGSLSSGAGYGIGGK